MFRAHACVSARIGARALANIQYIQRPWYEKEKYVLYLSENKFEKYCFVKKLYTKA